MNYLPKIAKAIAAYIVTAFIGFISAFGVGGIDSTTPLVEVVEILVSALLVAVAVWAVPNKPKG